MKPWSKFFRFSSKARTVPLSSPLPISSPLRALLRRPRPPKPLLPPSILSTGRRRCLILVRRAVVPGHRKRFPWSLLQPFLQGYEDAGAASSVLTPFLPDIITCVIATAERTDASDSKLRSAAYETLNELIRCSNLSKTAKIIQQLLYVIMNNLGQTLELPVVSSDDREKQGDLQALLCGVLQVIIQKLSSSDETKNVILHVSDQIMILFLKIFACYSSTVHEEAMLAIGALAYAIGEKFGSYMPEFYKYLEMGLQNFEEYQVFSVTVGVVGDICRALDDKILPYCDGIMALLLKDLSSGELHRSVKPPIFSCFGDIALAIGAHFEKYVAYAIPMMQGAAEVSAKMETNDDEMLEYGNRLFLM